MASTIGTSAGGGQANCFVTLCRRFKGLFNGRSAKRISAVASTEDLQVAQVAKESFALRAATSSTLFSDDGNEILPAVLDPVVEISVKPVPKGVGGLEDCEEEKLDTSGCLPASLPGSTLVGPACFSVAAKTRACKGAPLVFVEEEALDQKAFLAAFTAQFEAGELALLGKGSYARVYRFTYKGIDYAVKVLKAPEELLSVSSRDNLLFERESQASFLSHSHLCKTYFSGSVTVKKTRFRLAGTYPCLVMEYAASKTLRENTKYFTFALTPKQRTILRLFTKGDKASAAQVREHLRRVRRLIRGLVEGMDFLHLHGIIHRDLALKNILLRGEISLKARSVHPLISDFGLSRNTRTDDGLTPKDYQLKSPLAADRPFSAKKRFSFAGTPCYRAPEVVSEMYNRAADVWSFGYLLYRLCSLKNPVGDIRVVAQDVKKNLLDLHPLPKEVPFALQQMITACLQVESAKRPTFAELKAHPFLRATTDSLLGVYQEELRSLFAAEGDV